ncbi:STM4015 family protein [Streptomyces sp. NPDC093085]|uniref:STM4015 family protein n=1 Tax=Streptomyces sp. NPDC093085 TaxID=3155068 RepID=UPI00342ACCE4
MTIGEHLRELHGLPSFPFPGPDGAAGAALPDPASVAWRLSTDTYDAAEEWPELLARFTEAVDTTAVRALIVGAWSEAYDSSSEPIVAALVAARDRLPALRALFIGDMTFDECEISWITQSSLSPLLDAFPELESFGARGGTGLAFPPVRHARLRSLTVETGGLDSAVVRDIAASELPALTHLDLWLGSDEYGATTGLADLAPILNGERFPLLRSLGLRDSVIQDQIAGALATAPVVARLETLDLSLGILGDPGGRALLDGQPLTHLKKLDLHHHYLGDAVRDELVATLGAAGVEVDVSDPQTADADDTDEEGEAYRYVAVAE